MDAKKSWEMTEDEFVAAAFQRDGARAVTSAKLYEKALADLGPRAEKKRHEYEFNVAHFKSIAERPTPTPAQDSYNRKRYFAIIKEAISKGMPVSTEIIEQKPEFQLARTARERYVKGRHTSFANRSAAVDDSMFEERGFKVKRQDGKTLTPEQTAYIFDGMDEIASVVGPFKDIMTISNPTIAHTNGKCPFLRNAGGVYHHAYRTITAGTARVRALGHEWAHWLDIEAGYMAGAESRLKNGNTTSSLAEAETVNDTLLVRARYSINDTTTIRRLLSKRKDVNLPEEEIAPVRMVLGAYWNCPREIWARLVEQFIATRLAAAGRTPRYAVEPVEKYQRLPGWWSVVEFASLEVFVAEEIQRRMNVMRGHAEEEAKRVKFSAVGIGNRGLQYFRAIMGFGLDRPFATVQETENGWVVTRDVFDRAEMKWKTNEISDGGMTEDQAKRWATGYLQAESALAEQKAA